jgi:hypothetical protein
MLGLVGRRRGDTSVLNLGLPILYVRVSREKLASLVQYCLSRTT